MTILHRIKFWIAQQRGYVAKKRVIEPVVLTLGISQQKKMLEDQFLIEKDPLKLAELDKQYLALEERERHGKKQKLN